MLRVKQYVEQEVLYFKTGGDGNKFLEFLETLRILKLFPT